MLLALGLVSFFSCITFSLQAGNLTHFPRTSLHKYTKKLFQCKIHRKNNFRLFTILWQFFKWQGIFYRFFSRIVKNFMPRRRNDFYAAVFSIGVTRHTKLHFSCHPLCPCCWRIIFMHCNFSKNIGFVRGNFFCCFFIFQFCRIFKNRLLPSFLPLMLLAFIAIGKTGN